MSQGFPQPPLPKACGQRTRRRTEPIPPAPDTRRRSPELRSRATRRRRTRRTRPRRLRTPRPSVRDSKVSQTAPPTRSTPPTSDSLSSPACRHRTDRRGRPAFTAVGTPEPVGLVRRRRRTRCTRPRRAADIARSRPRSEPIAPPARSTPPRVSVATGLGRPVVTACRHRTGRRTGQAGVHRSRYAGTHRADTTVGAGLVILARGGLRTPRIPGVVTSV